MQKNEVKSCSAYNRVSFTIVGEIKTKQRPRAVAIGNHARVYTPEATINYENYIKSEYLRQANVYFDKRPIEVYITCYFRVNKQLEEYGDLINFLACTTHKDLDNVCKIVLDALNHIAWDDDKQIVEITAGKEYTLDEEKIVVRIVDASSYYDFLTIDDLRKYKKIEKLEDRRRELNEKPKLNKAEKDRLASIEKELKALCEKD